MWFRPGCSRRSAGLPLRPARRVRDLATLLAMVAEGLGVTVVPALALPGSHGLAVVALTPAAHRVLHLVPGPNLPAAGRALLEITRAHHTPSQPST